MHLGKRPCKRLSQGQSQRVALARTALSGRAVWIMDEPAAPLDTKNKKRLNELVHKHRENGGIVLASTHIPLGWPNAQRLELPS